MRIGLYESETAMLKVECPDRFHIPFPGADMDTRNKCQGYACPMFREIRAENRAPEGYYCGKGGIPK